MRLGKYFLIRVGDLVLEVQDGKDRPGVPVVMATPVDEMRGNDHQLWFYDPLSKTIRSKLNYYCVTERDDMVVCSRPFMHGSDKQRWIMSDSNIQMERDFESVIGLPEESVLEPGTELCVVQDDGSGHVDLTIEHVSANFFFIRSQENEGKVLDVYKAEKKAGSKIICWQDKGTMADNQLWYEDETGIIRSKLNGFAIDATGKDLCLQPYQKANHLQQWVIHGNLIQLRNNTQQVIEYKATTLGFLKGDQALKSRYKGTTSQTWLFEPVPTSASSMNHTGLGRLFYVRSKLTGLVLGLENGKRTSGNKLVTAYRDEESEDQLFYLDEITGTIRSHGSDYCWDGQFGEATISAYDAYSKLQQWKISGYKIRNRQEENLVLESQDGEPNEAGDYEPGHKVTFSQDEDRPSQQWEITFLPARAFFLVSSIRGNVMDVTKDEASAGAKIILWNRKSPPSANQLWYEDEKGIVRSKMNGYVIQADGKGARTMPFDPSNQSHYWMVVGDRIQNKYKRDEVLDVTGIAKMKYSGIASAKYSGGGSQQWKMDYV